MNLRSWMRQALGFPGHRAARGPRRVPLVRRRARLRCEELEARWAPAAIVVTDPAAGQDNPSAVTVATLGPFVSLRDALNAANNTPGADTVVLAKTTYTFNQVDNNWYGPTGLPPIASPITIEGNGATLQRSGANGIAPFRLFY